MSGQRPEKRGSNPIVIRIIAIVAGAIVVAGVIWAAALGHLF
jgi:hypothetical protein